MVLDVGDHPVVKTVVEKPRPSYNWEEMSGLPAVEDADIRPAHRESVVGDSGKIDR